MMYSKLVDKQYIDKGWSGDKKYCAKTADGTKYLLRITPKEKSDKHQDMFRMQQKCADLGVPMCKPLEIGECEEGVYIIQTWINGKDAEDVIPYLTPLEQYTLGFEAGKILKKIHTIYAPDGLPKWEEQYNRKIDHKIKMYRECPLKYDNGELLLSYIENNRHLLRNRPQCYQHGDYHRGNMMIENGKLVIIDFDRYDYGDPWEDMKAITWDVAVSPYFASGRIDGYFEHDVPGEFWRLLALYISMGVISFLPWAIPFGEEEIETMRTMARDVLDWYDNMTNPIPKWYGAR